jgi:hypothetical protein
MTSSGGWNARTLAALKPGETMVFRMDLEMDRARLRRWLEYADTIIGMNLQFDLLYLRCDPEFRFALGEQTLIDLSVLNYLHDEQRPEKSLKDLGPILRSFSYKRTLRDARFISPTSPELRLYNAQDTHNTMLAVAEFARRIGGDFPVTDKLSPYCIQFYSDTIWTCVRMSEAGVPMSRDGLLNFERQLVTRCARAELAADRYELQLSGTGSGLSKDEFLGRCIQEVDAASPNGSTVRSHPLLMLTPKQKKVSFSQENRNLLSSLLPAESPLQRALKHADRHTKAQKLLSTYTFPLLHHRRNRPFDRSSLLVQFRGSALAFPSWFVTPGPQKDSSGVSGGTIQGRITCKSPPIQTFPPSVKEQFASRFGVDGAIVAVDLSQIELRVAALLSGEPSLIFAYQEKRDLHAERAALLQAPRQVGKTINFADLYLAGPHRLRETLMEETGNEYSLEFCYDIVNSRPRHRPHLCRWQYSLGCTAERDARIELPLTGQSRAFRQYHPDHAHFRRRGVLRGLRAVDEALDPTKEIVNFPIQTTAGNVLLRIQSRLHQVHLPHFDMADPPVYMMVNIYDAIYFDCRRNHVRQLLDDVRYSVKYVETQGYWAQLQELTGNVVPLEWGYKVHTS